MIPAETLKENRDQIINMINTEMENQNVEISLKEVMIKVVEYSKLGCYWGMEDMEDIVRDSVQEVEEERFNKVMEEGQDATYFFQNRNAEILKEFNSNKF